MIRLSFSERIQIVDFLKEPMVLKVVSEHPKLCSYLNGWNDEKVAIHLSTILNRTVTPSNIGGIRKELFGNQYFPNGKHDDLKAALALISELEAKINAQEIRIGKLELAIKFAPART